MAQVKSRWMQEVEPFENEGFEDLLFQIRAFTNELQEDNDRAEERENERARQRLSIWEI
jgi:hypothetical protein